MVYNVEFPEWLVNAVVSHLVSAVAQRLVSQQSAPQQWAPASRSSVSLLASAVAQRLASQRVSAPPASASAPAGVTPANASQLASGIARRIVEGTPQHELISNFAAGGAPVEAIADEVARYLASAKAVAASAPDSFAATLTAAVAQRLQSGETTASADQIERMADAVALAIQLTTGAGGRLPAQDVDVNKVLGSNATQEPGAEATGSAESGAGKPSSTARRGRTPTGSTGGNEAAGSGGSEAGGASS